MPATADITTPFLLIDGVCQLIRLAMISLILASTQAGCGSAVGAGNPVIECRAARIDGDQLTLIVNRFRRNAFGRSVDVRQYIVEATLATEDRQPGNIRVAQFAAGRDGGGYFMLGPRGDTVLLIRGLGLTVIDRKAYAIAALRVVSRDRATSRWTERGEWSRSPFFVDPDVTRLLVHDAPETKAFRLPSCEPEPLENAAGLFAAIGSNWESLMDTVVDGVDGPPDYTGLTQQLDYASADAGIIFARFIHDRRVNQSRPLPRPIKLSNFGDVYVDEVRHNGQDWEFRCLKFGPLPKSIDPRVQPPGLVGMVVVSDADRAVLGSIAESHEVRDFAESTGDWWDPRQRIMLSWDDYEDAAQTGVFTLKLWRYGPNDDASTLSTIEIDVQSMFPEIVPERRSTTRPR